jgi:hypothetical protein
MGGEWGIRALKDSTAMKDSAFTGCAALSMLWGRSGGGHCKKKILNKNTFEAGICMKKTNI